MVDRKDRCASDLEGIPDSPPLANQFFVDVKPSLITTCADERFLDIDASGIRSLCPNLYLYES